MDKNLMSEEYLNVLKQCAFDALNRLDAAVDIDYLDANGTYQFADDMLGMMSELIETDEWQSKR